MSRSGPRTTARDRSRRRPLYAAASLLVLAACNGDDSIGPAVTSGAIGHQATDVLTPTGRIAFVRGRHIYIMNANGSGVTQLTHSSAANDSPAWSPDGRKIAFVRYLSTSDEIFVMNADGTGVTRLTNNGYIDAAPVWSPDGRKIAFVSDRAGLHNEIFVMNANGSNVVQLTNDLPYLDCHRLFSYRAEYSPTWSPDGTRIAFLHRVSCFEVDIDIMQSNGTGVTALAKIGASHIAWGKTGKIAFDVQAWPGDTGGDAEIGLLTVSSGSVTRLTSNTAADLYPMWSPDGARIAFQSTRDRDGDWEIYTMSGTGTGVSKLTNNSVFDVSPAWGP